MNGNVGCFVPLVLLPEQGGKGCLTRNGDVTADRHAESQSSTGAYLGKGIVFIGNALFRVVQMLPTYADFRPNAEAQSGAVAPHGAHTHRRGDPDGAGIPAVLSDGHVARD